MQEKCETGICGTDCTVRRVDRNIKNEILFEEIIKLEIVSYCTILLHVFRNKSTN